MRVVVCKNCGANFQIDDDEDINTYECSVCAGNLEYDDIYDSVNSNENIQKFNTSNFEKSYHIVQCNSCGLKFKINNNENINDYECSSCGGQLRYVEDYLNNTLNPNTNDFVSEEIPIEDNEAPIDDYDDYIYVDHSHDDDAYVDYDYYDNSDLGLEEFDQTEFLNSNDEIYPEHQEDNYIEESINDYIKENNVSKNNDIISENNTLDDYYNDFNNNTETMLKGREVSDSLDYNILKDYLIESFKEKMMNIYNVQNFPLEKKT